jgi:hypothetical protein
MAEVKTKDLPQSVRDIAGVIRGLCIDIMGDHDAMLEARDLAKTHDAKEATDRMSICVKIATLSAAKKWAAEDIDAACAYAKNQPLGNRPTDDKTSKTIAVFCSEMKSIAHPRVRERFPTMLTACQQAWDAETLITEGEKPIKKFKSRFYKLVIAAANATKRGEVSITTPDNVVDWAIENDPDFDEDKIEKRLHTLSATMSKISSDFGDPKIRLACEYIGTITAKSLKNSRVVMKKKLKAEEAARMAGHKLADVVVPIKPVETHETIEPAAGAFDLNAALNDDEDDLIEDDLIEDEIDESASLSPAQLVAMALRS